MAGRKPKPENEREGIRHRMIEARTAISSPAGKSRDAFAREDLKIDSNRYVPYETKGSDPGYDELQAMYSRAPKVKAMNWDPGAIASWVLTDRGVPPWRAEQKAVEAALEADYEHYVGRAQALHKEAKELGVSTPWPDVVRLAEVGQRMAAAGDVMAEDGIRETIGILVNLKARVKTAKYLGPEVRRQIDAQMVTDELRESPTLEARQAKGLRAE